MNGALCLSITGFSCYFSFARISSALMPSASSFFRTDSASVFFASSAALASAFAFFASSLTISLSIAFSDAFFSFRSAFKVSMFTVMDAISAVSASFADCFSAICVTKSHHLSLCFRQHISLLIYPSSQKQFLGYRFLHHT